MQLEWIEDVLAVAETGSLAEAARRRNLSPSAFSRRIQGIEAALGAELFDRSRKPIQLHAAAAGQRDRMADLARSLRRLRDDLRQGGVPGGRLVIASQHALTASLTPALVHGLQARRPEARVRLRSANLAECLALLLAGEADVALAYRLPGEAHPVRADVIETVRIGGDRLVPVLEPGAAERLPEGEATDLPVIAYPPEVFLGQVMERRIRPQAAGRWRPVPRVETALTLAALELAATGIGVAWVPASLAAARIAAGGLADLSGRLGGCDLDVTAVRLRGRRTAFAAAMWDDLTAALGT